MNPELERKLQEIILDLYQDFTETGGGKGYRYFHSTLTADYAKKIVKAEKLEVDEDALIVACLFHDIRKLEAVDEQGVLDYDHPCSVEDDFINPEHITKHTENLLPKEIVEKVVSIVREKDSPESPIESKVLHDADNLCNAGVLQTWRTISYAIITDRDIHDTVNFWTEEMLKQEIDSADRLYFEISKRTAQKRTMTFINWLENMRIELSGEDIV